jgi:hypothetical protein
VLEARRPVPVAEIEEGDFFEEETIVPARAPALAALPAAPAAPAEADPDVGDLVERAILAHRRRVLAGSLAVLGALAGVAAALLR